MSPPRTNSSASPRRRGQALILASGLLFVMFSVVGFAVDLGMAYAIKQQAQTAADSAATAAAVYALNHGYVCGAGGVVCGTAYNCAYPVVSSPADPLQAGCVYAHTNGFDNAGWQTVSLIANNTAVPNEAGTSPSYWVQANVTQSDPILFLYWAGFHTAAINSQAIAAITMTPPANCIYALNGGNKQDAFLASGAVSINATCGVFVNSSNSKALEVLGSSSLTAPTIVIHGNYNKGSSASISPNPPTTGAPVTADPLASLPAPTVTNTCDHTNYSLSHSDTATISQGTYCGGISVTGSAVLTLNPGTYILNGGGLTIGNSGKVTGTGVTFFLTGQFGHTAGPLSATGASILNVTAPSTGTYKGILFYQDRNVTYASVNTIGNSAVLTGTTGTYYFPTTAISYSGAAAGAYVALVADTVSITNSASFLKDPSGDYTGLAGYGSGLIQ